jgi:hypothetical protein
MAKIHRRGGDTAPSERYKLNKLLTEATDHLNASKLTQNGRINFTVHGYGESDLIDRNEVKQMKEKGELEPIEVGREKDIPFRTQGIEFLDFGYFFETKDWKNDILTEEEEWEICASVADFLEQYELIVHHDDGPYGFGHYAPWYVDGKTPTRIEYGLDEITDLHPYSALREQESCNCSDYADLEIYEDDFVVMECGICGRTATFRQEGPYDGPRRNPASMKKGKTIGIFAGAIIAALIAKKALD